MRLEDLQPGLTLVGLEPSSLATVAAVVPIGEGSVQVFYRTPAGRLKRGFLGASTRRSSASPWPNGRGRLTWMAQRFS
jgi:hypothetical protein